MQARNVQVRSLSYLSSALLLVALVLLNVAFGRVSARIDLTEEGLYTLSDGSRAILEKLEDPVTIKVFWADVPVRFDLTKRYVAALLDEMEEVSGGLVQPTWVDMTEESSKDEASELKVQQYVFAAEHGDEVRQQKGYMSLVIEMGEEKPRTFDVLFEIQEQLEYLIIATIYQRSRTTAPVIGMVSNKPFNPFGGGRQRGNFNDVEAMLQQTFGTNARTYLDLEQPVPEDVDVLILARPRNLTAEQVYRFEQFLLRGGRGIVLEDPADLDNVLGRGRQQAEPHASGLEDWFGHLGLTVERGAVADFRYRARFPRSATEFLLYPYWPQIPRSAMDMENPVMRSMPPMTLYWPAALSIDQAKQEAAGRKATVLATTSPSGYRRSSITALAQAFEDPEGKLLEAVPLIALFEGPATSFWLGKPVPGSTPPAPDPADPDPAVPGPGGVEPGDGPPAKGDAAGSPDGDATGSPDGDAPAPPAPDEPKKEAPKKEAPKKEVPKQDDPKQDDPKQDDPKQDDGDEEADAEEEEAPARIERGDIRLLVMGDADCLDDRIVRHWVTRNMNGNIAPAFLLGMTEWLSGSDELLELRARATNPRHLDTIEEADRKMIQHLNLWTVPLLVILAGLTMFFVRRMS